MRLDAITRVMYNLDEWATAPEKLLIGGRVVRLDGSRLHATSTLEILGINRKKILLLIVPPHIDPHRAHETMMAAAAPNNASTVDDLLMMSARGRETGSRTAGTEKRWTANS